MKKLYMLGLLCLLITIQSCKKDDPQIDPVMEYELIQISTTFGDVHIWLYDETPKHKENFLKLTKEGFYTGTTFHRIIDGFMIQGGDPNSKDNDPNNDGTGGPGYTIPAEIKSSLKHDQGALGAARLGNDTNPEKESSGSQFYIVEGDNGAHHLDGEYTVFGEVLKGIETVQTIAEQPKNSSNRPTTDIPMTVTVIKKSGQQLKDEYGFEL